MILSPELPPKISAASFSSLAIRAESKQQRVAPLRFAQSTDSDAGESCCRSCENTVRLDQRLAYQVKVAATREIERLEGSPARGYRYFPTRVQQDPARRRPVDRKIMDTKAKRGERVVTP